MIPSSSTAWGGSSFAWATTRTGWTTCSAPTPSARIPEIAAHLGEVLWVKGRSGRRRESLARFRPGASGERAASGHHEAVLEVVPPRRGHPWVAVFAAVLLSVVRGLAAVSARAQLSIPQAVEAFQLDGRINLRVQKEGYPGRVRWQHSPRGGRAVVLLSPGVDRCSTQAGRFGCGTDYLRRPRAPGRRSAATRLRGAGLGPSA